MCFLRLLFTSLTFLQVSISQEIWDVWQTTWDQSKQFTPVPVSSPITFGTPGPPASADITVNETTLYQQIDGMGASLTDSSAWTLNNLKDMNGSNYWTLLNYMFNTTYAANSAGLSYIRVAIGASDFSENLYSLDDVAGDISFTRFNIDNAPPYLFSVLSDILSINSRIKVHILPWSPPGWMKDGGTMNGGNLLSQYYSVYCPGFQSKGIPIYAISIQNEPQNSNPTYPTCTISPNVEALLGNALRSLLNNNGLASVKIVAYEHNWNDAVTYPVQVVCTKCNTRPDAFAGAAFHCYAGSVLQSSKEVYFTECTGTYGSDWWSDIKWYMNNIFIGSLQNWARTALMWNLALDESGHPMLPGTNSCRGGCRPVVTVYSEGHYILNQEFWSMAQASKAITPKDPDGPFGQRIGVTVGGSLSWALNVGAYVVNRVNPESWKQYSIVVLNWNDNIDGVWLTEPVTATIEFRGLQATYTFPVGVTTLWWFAP
ncbi:glycoside hydrolase family 30 protein [Amanita rubescens]|nr:glycoside hydrolase family 30 protein [Amanita rubescens]